MEMINTIELSDPEIYPHDEVLQSILGASYPAYVSLLELYKTNNMNVEWRYYHDGKAWLCKVQAKKRTIVWMSAWKGYVQATVYFPERYLDDIMSLDMSDETKERIRNTKNTGKSRPCIFEMRNKTGLKDFSAVMGYKLAIK